MIDVTAILLSAILSSVAAGAVAFHFLRQTAPQGANRSMPDHDARFLFQGRELLNVSGGGQWLFETGHGKGDSDWDQLRHVLAPRFPGLPVLPENMDADIVTCPTNLPDDEAELLLERINDLTRVTLLQHGDSTAQPADIHRRLMTDTRLETLEQAVEGSPYPIWASNCDGRITWANDAYKRLAENADTLDNADIPTLFDLPEVTPPAVPRTRLSLTLKESDSNIWFDVTSSQSSVGCMHYAIDINAVVQAEIAQRNFVQTLTKTFAQLSIGLVIFDRRRQLALFNPALIDLLGLSPEFLSSRPTLFSFFDRLRDMQIMPEPKNYRNWREDMSDLVTAASDGGYLETWNLPSGLTYRVSGRPHPDGAIAFLFEDISSEVSLTRRFRSQLEVLQALVDGMPQAVAIFSPSSVLTFANESYRTLWRCDPDSSFADLTLDDAMRHWMTRATAQADLTRIHPTQTDIISIPLINGQTLSCRVQQLMGGNFAVIFGQEQDAPHLPFLQNSA
ncbi:PAS domain-containing protein [Thalassobius sp. S69A]|uniref:PAS domain-containing protein n=1 Tax=unclassified Thalassovita TaxID=2619711 RepID=UPI000C0D6D3B|nr:diguanylate cyclase [Paracoccaceae bacterium]MBT26574.1 diguanylate cyclase [Paracoccaceae bacterium]